MACDMEFHVAVAEASQNSMYSINAAGVQECCLENL